MTLHRHQLSLRALFLLTGLACFEAAIYLISPGFAGIIAVALAGVAGGAWQAHRGGSGATGAMVSGAGFALVLWTSVIVVVPVDGAGAGIVNLIVLCPALASLGVVIGGSAWGAVCAVMYIANVRREGR